MQTMSKPSDFPTAEGIGVFVGVAAWDLLTEGRLDVVKALALAASCALAWYGIRCWRDKRRSDRH